MNVKFVITQHISKICLNYHPLNKNKYAYILLKIMKYLFINVFFKQISSEIIRGFYSYPVNLYDSSLSKVILNQHHMNPLNKNNVTCYALEFYSWAF